MRFWLMGGSASLLFLNVACGGEDSSAATLMAAGGASGSDASADASSSAGSSTGGSGGEAGSLATGGSSGSGGGTGGSAGSPLVDASQPKEDGGGAKKDGGRTEADGGCSQTAEDKCDTCTEKHCCVQLDMCDANATCSAAFAAIDTCIGDSSAEATIKKCYTTFGDTPGTGQTAKNLYDCVVAQCAAQCRP